MREIVKYVLPGIALELSLITKWRAKYAMPLHSKSFDTTDLSYAMSNFNLAF